MPLNENDFKLIVIKAEDTSSGIEAEYRYIEQLHGPYGVGWELLCQRVTTYISSEGVDPVEVDMLTIQLANDEVKNIYFDISEFYGK